MATYQTGQFIVGADPKVLRAQNPGLVFDGRQNSEGKWGVYVVQGSSGAAAPVSAPAGPAPVHSYPVEGIVNKRPINVGGGIGGGMMIMSAMELEREAVQVDGMEMLPGVLYHTLTYPLGGIENLSAFTGSNDPFVSNLASNGIPQGQYFRATHLAITPFNDVTATTAATAAGAINDLARLIRETRATWTFNRNSKPWPRCPLNVVGQVGGVGGLIGGAGPDAASAVVQVPNLAVAPFVFPKVITLKALQQFTIDFQFKAGVTVSADLDFQVQLHGSWHRPVA